MKERTDWAVYQDIDSMKRYNQVRIGAVLNTALLLQLALHTSGQTPGALDSSFDPQIDGTVTHIVKQPDGKILIAGPFTMINGLRRPQLARLQPNGAVDASFAADLNDGVTALGLAPD